MKAKKQLHPLEAILGINSFMMDSILHPERIKDTRKSALTTHIGEITVDTVKPIDTNMWETGIQREGTWIIVEQYDDEQQAKVGHDIWVTQITNDPNMTLKDINIFGTEDDEDEQ